MKNALLASVLLLVGCGGATPPPEHAGHEEHGKEHEEHHSLSPALHEFHEVLAPVWHSTAGAERVAKTCAQAGALRDKATATSDGELIATVAALSAACDKEGRADVSRPASGGSATNGDQSLVEARLGAVHERFHTLAEHH